MNVYRVYFPGRRGIGTAVIVAPNQHEALKLLNAEMGDKATLGAEIFLVDTAQPTCLVMDHGN